MILAVANQKGGVGKTTTAVNLAACVAEAGYSAAVVDLDPQCNATISLGLGRSERPSTYDWLQGRATVDEVMRATSLPRLWLAASNPDLAGAVIELPRQEGWETSLAHVLAPASERFAFLFIDCPPSLGPLTINALVAADRLIVPVQAEYLALEGLAQLMETIDLVKRRLNPRLAVAGMLLTMHDGRTRLAMDVEREVRRHFPELTFRTVIPRNVRVGEAPSYGRPVIHHDPHCAGADAYFDLAKEVAERG